MLFGAKVTVIFPRVQVSRDFIDYPYFADLGAIQAAAVLRAAGAEVTLADALALPGSTLEPVGSYGGVKEPREGNSPAGDVVLGAPEDELFAKIPSGADVLVVAITPFHRPPARDATLGAALERLRRERPETPIVLADLYQSGQHVVDARSEDIAASYPEIDALVRYEAELDLSEIVGDLRATGRRGGARIVTGREPPRLDDLPLPAWDLVDLPSYFAFHERVTARLGRPSWAFPITSRSAPALTSRGCPYRCVHCSSNPTSRRDGAPIAPKTQRRYSPDYLDRLFADLVARGVRRVHLLDELTNVNEAHFDAVLALLRRHRLAFEIPNGVRADYLLPRHLDQMRGNLTTLSVSAESGVQRVVDRIVDKQLDLGAIRAAAENARDARVPLLVHFMIGLPGETPEDIRGTLEFALDLFEETRALPSVQFATPLPGTRLSRLAAEALAIVRPIFRPSRKSAESGDGDGNGDASGAPSSSRSLRSDAAEPAEAAATTTDTGSPGLADEPLRAREGAASDIDSSHSEQPIGARRLPMVRDWGPLFQQIPSTETAAFTPDHLQKARRAFELRMRAAEGPARLILSPTYRCNNRCPFCTTGTGALPEPDFQALREQLVQGRKRGATALSLDGGEPTLSDRLFPLVAFAKKIGYRAIDLTTNGRMAAYPEYADRLLSCGLTALTVSLHGPDAPTHTAHVGSPDAFEQTLTALRHLTRLSARTPVDLGVQLTLTKQNQDCLFDTAALVTGLGVRRFEILFLTPFGPGTPALAPDLDRAALEISRTIEAFRSSLRVRVHHLPPCQLPDHLESLVTDAEDLSGRLTTADPQVDTLAHVRARRFQKPECATCPFAVTCRGFFDLGDTPAPRWLVRAGALSA